MKISAILLLAAAVPLSTSAGNFCAVTAMGANCNFPDLQSCHQHLQGLGGQCVVNPQALPQSPTQPQPNLNTHTHTAQPYVSATSPLDAMRYVQQQGDAGRARGQDQAEHRARMELLKAQTDAVKSPRAQTNDGYWVMYRCPTPSGQVEYTAVPEPGCVVDFVTAY